MQRVFFAVDTSHEAKAVSAERISAFKKEFGDVRVSWAKPDNLHVTLKFIGDVEDEQIRSLGLLVDSSIKNIQPFTARFASPSAFGKRVLSIAIEDDSDSLSAINEILETASESLGFPREKRSFKPHLTLARIRDERGTNALISKHAQTRIEPVEWQVRNIVLYESKLQPTGSVYSKLRNIPLGG